MEPQDAPACPHRRETIRVPAVRGDVQAEGTPAETLMLGASQRHLCKQRWQRRPLQLLLLPALLRIPARADTPSVGPAQQPAAQQEYARAQMNDDIPNDSRENCVKM